MEHQKAASKPKSKILKFLPRATSSVSFQNPPLYSPKHDKRSSEKPHKSNLGIGLSGPLVSIIPSENRRKIKNDSTYTLVYEPTSPRVSCMGQVKCKHYRNKLAAAAAAADGATNKQPAKPTTKTLSFAVVKAHNKESDQEKIGKLDSDVKSKKKKGIRSLFRGGASSSSRRKSDFTNDKSTAACSLPRAPSMSAMKRFSSGRDAFKNFDWTTQVAPLNSAADRKYFTDDERDGGSDGEGDEEVLIPSSAPVIVRNKGICDNFVRGGVINLEPRKEINLWKRRTMPQPPPLQLHVA